MKSDQRQTANHQAKKHHEAFSLIEMTIVLIVLGILVAGVTQSSRLIGQSRLQTVRNLTQNSPINSTSDLVLWVETSMDAALSKDSSDTEIENGDTILSWNDRNPQSLNKHNLIQSDENKKPTFDLDGINLLPAVRFDGSNDFLATESALFDYSASNYTFIVVWRADSVKQQLLVGQGGNSNNSLGSIYLANDGYYGFAGIGNDYLEGTYSASANYISVIRVDNNSSDNVTLFSNSKSDVFGASNGDGYLALNMTTDEFIVGAKPIDHLWNFDGIISEIAVFNRSLDAEEITSIVGYLSQKYRITLH